MGQFWREYNIFISSTFKDMDAERDAIKQFVIPKLNSHYRKRCISFHAIDLRLGINTQNLGEEESENMVLGTCFNKIDSARPFFIGLLGERYGWIPQKDRIDFILSILSEQNRHLIDDSYEKSVTELEILYGALGGNGENIEHSIFFFRDPKSYQNIPPQILADYDDRNNTFLCSEKRAFLVEKQRRLKSLIKDACHNHLSEDSCIEYHLEWDNSTNSFADMSDFIDLVYNKLCCEINKEIGSDNTEPTWYNIEKESLSYLQHKSANCFINDNLLNEIIHSIRHYPRTVIVSDAGNGKTVLSSQLYNRLSSSPSNIVLMISPDISPYTNTVENILFYWIKTIEDILGLEWTDETVLKKDNAYEILYDTFYSLIDRAQKDEYNITAIIDGIESIQTGRELYYIKESIPLIVTAHTPLEGYNTIKLQNGSDITAQILHNHESRHNINLPDIVQRSILSDGLSPVTISLLSAMFSNLASIDFAQIRKIEHRTEIEKINDYITSIYVNAPKSSEELFIFALDFILKRIDGVGIRKAIEYIAISEEGLRISDLKVLLKNEWCELKFLILMELMGDFFIENPLTKQWKLCNKHFRNILNSHQFQNQKERELLMILDSYPDDDPIKQSLLLKLSISSQSIEIINKYLTGAFVADGHTSIWYSNIATSLMTSSESWYDRLACVMSEINSSAKISIVYSLYSVSEIKRDHNTFIHLTSLLKDIHIDDLKPHESYTLAYLFRDAYLMFKYESVSITDTSINFLEKALECYEACNNYRDSYITYTSMLADYATQLSMAGEFEKANEIFNKIIHQ